MKSYLPKVILLICVVLCTLLVSCTVEPSYELSDYIKGTWEWKSSNGSYSRLTFYDAGRVKREYYVSGGQGGTEYGDYVIKHYDYDDSYYVKIQFGSTYLSLEYDKDEHFLLSSGDTKYIKK